MDALNEIETLKMKNCIIHICGNSIVKTEEERQEVWQMFSNKAYELLEKVGEHK